MVNRYENPGRGLDDLISENTDKEQFEQLIEQLLPAYTKEALGDSAAEKIRDAVLYLSTFRDNYFDEAAFKVMVWPETDDEFKVILETLKQLGAVTVEDQYIGPTPEEDKEDREFLEKVKLGHLPPRPRHTAKNRLRVTSEKLAKNLHRILSLYD